jgi:molecular chaperone GrpE
MPSSPESERPEGAVEAPERKGESEEEEASGRDLNAELKQLDDRYRRALADLDNYRKRTAREIDQRVTERSEALIRDWLEAVDSVERALLMAEADGALRVGLQAVLEQMEAILERQGVRRVGAAGEPFDPERHEAVGVVSAPGVPERTVVEVARSGYALGDRVLRPAQVVVAQGAQGEARQGGSDGRDREEGEG